MNEPKAELRAALSTMYETSRLLASSYRKRPMFGHVFGAEFALGSILSIENDLHKVRYSVIHRMTDFPISISDTKEQAIASARRLLEGPNRDHIMREIAAIHRAAAEAQTAKNLERERELSEAYRSRKVERTPSIPKRRRQIFEKSDGKCHYCATPLTLDGRWHIEHKMPKALMGGNEPSNLVASCVPCNHKKRDMTDQEFIAQRANA